jgi:hypothetical protein
MGECISEIYYIQKEYYSTLKNVVCGSLDEHGEYHAK